MHRAKYGNFPLSPQQLFDIFLPENYDDKNNSLLNLKGKRNEICAVHRPWRTRGFERH